MLNKVWTRAGGAGPTPYLRAFYIHEFIEGRKMKVPTTHESTSFYKLLRGPAPSYANISYLEVIDEF